MSQIRAQATAQNSNETIYTVTAGKTLYITNYTLNVLNLGDGIYYGQLWVYTSGAAFSYYIARLYAGIEHVTSIGLSVNPPLIVQAAYTVRVYSPASYVLVTASIHGYEV